MASDLARIAGLADLLTDFGDIRDRSNASDSAWAVGTDTEYGFWPEVGTRDMPAYPWLEPAVRDVVRDTDRHVTSATPGDNV
jgi:hypothetical protein